VVDEAAAPNEMRALLLTMLRHEDVDPIVGYYDDLN
jgi:hypothetical protein